MPGTQEGDPGKTFKESPREYIVRAVIVDRNGIKAVFQR